MPQSRGAPWPWLPERQLSSELRRGRDANDVRPGEELGNTGAQTRSWIVEERCRRRRHKRPCAPWWAIAFSWRRRACLWALCWGAAAARWARPLPRASVREDPCAGRLRPAPSLRAGASLQRRWSESPGGHNMFSVCSSDMPMSSKMEISLDPRPAPSFLLMCIVRFVSSRLGAKEGGTACRSRAQRAMRQSAARMLCWVIVSNNLSNNRTRVHRVFQAISMSSSHIGLALDSPRLHQAASTGVKPIGPRDRSWSRHREAT